MGTFHPAFNNLEKALNPYNEILNTFQYHLENLSRKNPLDRIQNTKNVSTHKFGKWTVQSQGLGTTLPKGQISLPHLPNINSGFLVSMSLTNDTIYDKKINLQFLDNKGKGLAIEQILVPAKSILVEQMTGLHLNAASILMMPNKGLKYSATISYQNSKPKNYPLQYKTFEGWTISGKIKDEKEYGVVITNYSQDVQAVNIETTNDGTKSELTFNLNQNEKKILSWALIDQSEFTASIKGKGLSVFSMMWFQNIYDFKLP